MGGGSAGGLLSDGWARPEDLAVVEALSARRLELADCYRGVRVVEAPIASDGAVIAVKPADVAAAAGTLREVGIRRVVSIAAGVTICRCRLHSVPTSRSIRATPNTPALVGVGCTGIAAGPSANADDLAWATGVLAVVGTVVPVSEPLLDAVNMGLTGSGPADPFFFYRRGVGRRRRLPVGLGPTHGARHGPPTVLLARPGCWTRTVRPRSFELRSPRRAARPSPCSVSRSVPVCGPRSSMWGWPRPRP